MVSVPPYSFEIDPFHTALIIVDMQYATGCRSEGLGKLLGQAGLLDEKRSYFEQIEQVVIPNLQKIIGYFRENSLPVIFVQSGSELADCADAPPHRIQRYRIRNQYRGQRAFEILDEIKPQPNDHVVNKTTVSAFTSSGLESLLHALNVDCVLVGGILTDVCVALTARNAADFGFNSLVVEDCCCSDDETHHRVELETHSRLFGRTATTQTVIGEMSAKLRSHKTTNADSRVEQTAAEPDATFSEHSI